MTYALDQRKSVLLCSANMKETRTRAFVRAPKPAAYTNNSSFRSEKKVTKERKKAKS